MGEGRGEGGDILNFDGFLAASRFLIALANQDYIMGMV
jgi:hypothetical protein